ncbi:uncharacterized protein LOC112596656 [Melanaphis sacchari]|uniref:uncharacterized protein LOC112596656 n=1 Tax=Melanaphis sacchari TaxID=742174 RepID=UPI000DC13341|nr:uncharacterized protein LOC112596656 [Melanaphis sacchari]XP_025198201.1 uncharacterized protein LOC112596656 [Melanaphis sacchari]
MSEPGPNTTIECTKSMPCIELASPILFASNHSLGSYKSCDADHQQEIQKPTEISSNVNILIDKHRSCLDKLLNAKINDFIAKKKSFANAYKNVCNSYNDCIKIEGDSKQVENVDNFVKNHVFEVFNANVILNNPKPLNVEKYVLKSNDIDFKTGTPELDKILTTMGKRFWQNIVSVVSVNNFYYQCLTQIMDTRKFKNLEDVIVHVNSTLKIAGDDFELIRSELVASSKEYMENFGSVLDSKLNEKPKKTSFLNYDSNISVLRMELAKNKRYTKIAENSIAQFRKEKKDLLNILASYDSENIHKVSLEKRLEAEQQKNNELRDLIRIVFKEKMPFT